MDYQRSGPNSDAWAMPFRTANAIGCRHRGDSGDKAGSIGPMAGAKWQKKVNPAKPHRGTVRPGAMGSAWRRTIRTRFTCRNNHHLEMTDGGKNTFVGLEGRDRWYDYQAFGSPRGYPKMIRSFRGQGAAISVKAALRGPPGTTKPTAQFIHAWYGQ